MEIKFSCTNNPEQEKKEQKKEIQTTTEKNKAKQAGHFSILRASQATNLQSRTSPHLARGQTIRSPDSRVHNPGNKISGHEHGLGKARICLPKPWALASHHLQLLSTAPLHSA